MPLIGSFPSLYTDPLPVPTSLDAGKVLTVNASGRYVLMDAATWFNSYIAPTLFQYTSAVNELNIVTE